MKRGLTHELEVDLPAGDVWEIYSTIRLAELTVELAPSVISKVDILQGDGGAGSVLQVFYPPGTPGPPYHKEKFVKIDDERHVKEVEIIEGGYLELGFSYFLIRFEIVEKGSNSSIIKSVVEYEISDELAANVSYVTTAPFAGMAETITKYLMEKKAGI